MSWEDVTQQQCPIARASAVLGDRWSLLILSDFFLGVRRFDDFQERLNIPRTTLANRLKRLQDHGVIDRRVYREQPTRYEYRLTQKGRDLFPVITTLASWGDKYYFDESELPILRQHKSCGHDIQPVLTCPECHEPVDADSITVRKRPEIPGLPTVKRGPISYSSM